MATITKDNLNRWFRPNKFIKSNFKVKLNDSKRRAEKYLSIIEKIERTGQYSKEEEEWLLKNCLTLQREINYLKFPQLQPGMQDGYGRTIIRMEHPIAFFTNLLKAIDLPLDVHLVIKAIKSTLYDYIQKLKELIENPKDLEKLSKKDTKKKMQLIEFNTIKLIEILFAVLFGTGMVIILNENTFIAGFILILIGCLTIFILSFLRVKKENVGA